MPKKISTEDLEVDFGNAEKTSIEEVTGIIAFMISIFLTLNALISILAGFSGFALAYVFRRKKNEN